LKRAPAASRRLRILLHAQHLTGVGHFVRMREIAKALAPHHEVHRVVGGRPVPGADGGGATSVELPRIARVAGRLAPLDCEATIEATLAERSRVLAAAVARLRPDVVVVEHYPFSKWELRGELEAAIGAARAANGSVRILCSVRDVLRQTRHEDCTPELWVTQVLEWLHAGFDALLVHGDPALTRFEDHFPGTADIRIPLEYTNIVAETPRRDDGARQAIERLTGGAPYVLASTGGGADAQDLLAQCIRAWRLLQAEGAMRDVRLVICTGLDGTTDRLRALADAEGAAGVVVLPFSPEYPGWLATARLSVSCAGYNTAANLLRVKCRALLVPDAAMSDQPERARLLAARGVAAVLDPGRLDARRLADAMRATAARPLPRHDIRLDGAERTRAIIERLAR
jgi:predicted glycosyltransferase